MVEQDGNFGKPLPAVDAIVIGRNEGGRLIDCLASLQAAGIRRLIYVDSGSSDGSPEAARAAGAEVVALDMTRPFTAARARNAGLALIRDGGALPDFVHFIDGDCQLQPGWLQAACDFLSQHPQAVVACGRRRERFPEASVYNRLCDLEWDTPVGEAAACGGDALMRTGPILASGGYRDDLIAGEEPELCLRLRRAGGQVWRLDHEMTLHDAAMTRFSQWWRRSRRAGHAFAEGAALHGSGPERHWVAETRRALAWGAILPLAILAVLFVSPSLALLMALAYPAQVLRLAARRGVSQALSWQVAVFTVLGKFAEAQGVLSFWKNRLLGRRGGLIEYK
ncbi:glycosyltransferase [Paracoccus siganidrum]|uniref:Glycosyltransferase family 2 protein n=1 Tax=Paracoccus siganidrum TaxID=1276757 RepID=A0A419A716_9RHOB|nr:glycosyltransferase family 2 protein [Paracoccus siganidrum]RJL15304.1 glycosyltransferase family 2 protein [Paracoccus siganidrum]RMC39365.1 glycosyltransferase family 2 protein [Paracoccus siganidrum]